MEMAVLLHKLTIMSCLTIIYQVEFLNHISNFHSPTCFCLLALQNLLKAISHLHHSASLPILDTPCVSLSPSSSPGGVAKTTNTPTTTPKAPSQYKTIRTRLRSPNTRTTQHHRPATKEPAKEPAGATSAISKCTGLKWRIGIREHAWLGLLLLWREYPLFGSVLEDWSRADGVG